MKKTAISLLLALAMVFSLVLVAAPQAQAAAHTDHCVCGGKAVGVGDHTTCTTATNWVDLNSVTDITTAGVLGTEGQTTNYYLSADLVVTTRLAPAKDSVITICLNGFTLSSSAEGDKGRVIYFTGTSSVGATVNVCDCKGIGAITSPAATNGVAVYMYGEEATFNLFGGSLYGGGAVATNRGGIIYMHNASDTFNMYGGMIMGGKSNDRGGNVMLTGTMNMYGGIITGGEVVRSDEKEGKGGGNIHVATESTLNLYGGSVTGGSADPYTCDIYVLAGATLNVKNLDDTAILYVQEGGTVNTTDMDSSLTKQGSGTDLTLTKGTPAPSDPPQEPTQAPTTDNNDGSKEDAAPMNPIIWVVIVVVGVAVVVAVIVIIKKKKA